MGGVGRRGAVWPTGLDWLAMATAGAANDIASISPGMEATKNYIIKSTLASWWWALIRTLTISGSCHNECSIDEDGIC